MTRCVYLSFLILLMCFLKPIKAQDFAIQQLTNFENLPYLKSDVQVNYSGSIDRTGMNSDWDWCLYEENGEFVLMETDGPGCIVNILTYYNNLNQASGNGKFRFYFDGAKVPQFELSVDSIGYQYPFITPLADDWNYIGKRGCRIRRSFVPMPFKQSCKVTFNERLMAFQTGGWGHIIYHTYTTLPINLETFTGKGDYAEAIQTWKKVGFDPKTVMGNEIIKKKMELHPGESETVFEIDKPGSIAAIRFYSEYMDASGLQNIYIKIFWDDQSEPAVYCPIGAFFGNELRQLDALMLSHGMTESDFMYNYFPMPYWKNAKVIIENKSKILFRNTLCEIHIKPELYKKYEQEDCGYFYASYKPRSESEMFKSIHIGTAIGHGHLVAGHITAYSCSDEREEEGDIQIFIDGNRTPQIESDGSESWPPYGWGFPVGPQYHPTSGYDGKVIPWSMVKTNLADWYPFNSRLDFYIEHGSNNTNKMEHSGAIFYYAKPKSSMVLTDSVDIAGFDWGSESRHNYIAYGLHAYGKELSDNQKESFVVQSATYEGELIGLRDRGKEFNKFSQFDVSIQKYNNGVKLRRRCDQSYGRQRAKVFVDGVQVKERDWYYADYNNSKKWLDHDFEIPSEYTKGKEKINIRIEFVSSELGTWNEYKYWIYSYIK